MYLCVFVYVCICVFVYLYMCVFVYLYMCVFVYVCICECALTGQSLFIFSTEPLRSYIIHSQPGILVVVIINIIIISISQKIVPV